MATYFIKYPNPKEKRRRFAVHRRAAGKSPAVVDPRLSAINERYAAGEDYALCVRLVRELVDDLRKQERPPELTLQDNLRVARLYLNSRKTRRLVDPYSAEQEILRAAQALGPLLLEHSQPGELQAHLDRHFSGAKHARLCGALNRLLRFLKKDFRLEPALVLHEEPTHILLSDFLQKLPAVEPIEHRLFLATLFATGARSGEAFALKSCRAESVRISQQLDKRLVTRQTKNARATPAHDAVIIPELVDYVREWCRVPDEKRREMRGLRWEKIARRWLGVTPHELRHSYAKRLCEKDCELAVVAANLGVNESVARRNYAGWLQTDYQLSALARRLRGGGPGT